MDAIEGRVIDPDDDDVFDLDVWLREAADEEIPYNFTVGGQLYSLPSPEEFDWQHHSRQSGEVNQADLRPFLQLLLGDEQYEQFCENRLPMKAINKILEGWQQHHGMDIPESRASRRASERTAKRSRPTSRRTTK